MTTTSVKNRRRQDIDRTGGQFGDSLEELTHRIYVPARVRDKVQETKQTVQVNADEFKQQARTKADDVEEQVQAKAEDVKQQGLTKAEDVKQHVHEGAEALHAKAAGMASPAKLLPPKAQVKLPAPVAERIEPLMGTVRQRPRSTGFVAVGVLFLLLLLLRRLLCSNE